MIVREVKLKLTVKQKNTFDDWLWVLTGVYNWASRKIKQDARDGFYYSKFDFMNLLKGHYKKIGIPSQTVQAILIQAWDAWDKCFKKVRKGEPKLKSIRNKLKSIPFPAPIKENHFLQDEKEVKLPIIGKIRFHKNDIPTGKIKRSRIVKRASGWYLQLTIDTNHLFIVQKTDKKVGIDTGFKDLAILSDGEKYENHRYYVKGQKRLAQAQRGNNKKLVARLHERTANRRKDRNHKVSREIVENNKEIYITNDNLRGQSKIFGKSVSDAGISQLRNFIIYKSDNHGRKTKLVESKYTTMTCSNCGARTGPTGLSGLAVRYWECSACRAQHDRDINAAQNILNIGAGLALEQIAEEKHRA
jgi:IS605 OrfB family transposase